MIEVRVQTDMPQVTIEQVAVLYAKFKRMDVPDYYEEGQRNPFAGLVDIIPETASAYAVIPEREEQTIEFAKLLLRGVGGRRKIRSKVCTKDEVNYTMFSKGGDVVVLYV